MDETTSRRVNGRARSAVRIWLGSPRRVADSGSWMWFKDSSPQESKENPKLYKPCMPGVGGLAGQDLSGVVALVGSTQAFKLGARTA